MNELEDEKTRPPQSSTRHIKALDLFNEFPQMSHFISRTPKKDNNYHAFTENLKNSKTPEDAIVFLAFAIERRLAIHWGLECVLDLSPSLPPDETQLINWVSEWIDSHTAEARWKTLQVALFAPRSSAAVYLGLAVGWSNGPLAPNDLVTVPKWRTPYAISTAILKSIGLRQPELRSSDINKVLEKGMKFLY